MAAPARQPEEFSVLFGTRNLWEDSNPSYALLTDIVGDSASDKTSVANAILAISARSPVVLASVLLETPDKIQILHSPTRFAADLTKPHLLLDGKLIVLAGDKSSAVAPLVIPSGAFERHASTACYATDYIRGVLGHSRPCRFWYS